MRQGWLGMVAILVWAGAAQAQTQQAQPTMPKIVEPPPPLQTAGEPVSINIDRARLAWARKPGTNTVTGEAVLRTRGGDVKGCGGLPAELWPMDDEMHAYLTAVIAVGSSGSVGMELLGAARRNTHPQLREYVRETVCNSQGAFTFRNVPDGRYLVTAQVTWEVPNLRRGSSSMDLQGGVLGKVIEVAGGTVQDVMLTR
jgi:hypothetical protein